ILTTDLPATTMCHDVDAVGASPPSFLSRLRDPASGAKRAVVPSRDRGLEDGVDAEGTAPSNDGLVQCAAGLRAQLDPELIGHHPAPFYSTVLAPQPSAAEYRLRAFYFGV